MSDLITSMGKGDDVDSRYWPSSYDEQKHVTTHDLMRGLYLLPMPMEQTLPAELAEIYLDALNRGYWHMGRHLSSF